MGELPNGVGAAAAAPLPAVMLEDEFASPAETTCFSAAPADDLAAASEGTPLPAMTFSAPTNALECVPPYGDTERKGVEREGEAEALLLDHCGRAPLPA
jgi:hypothetical protein